MSPQVLKALLHKRMVWVAVFLFVGFLLIAARLVVLQAIASKQYKIQAEGQSTLVKKLTPSRGEIKISDKFAGEPYTVATTIDKPLVYAVPSSVLDKLKTSEELAKLLGLESSEILPKLSDDTRKYVVLKKQLTEEEVKQIQEAKLPGIAFDAEISRFYPERDFLSNVLGYVGYKENDKVGLHGLEKYFETELKGTPGNLAQEKDAGGAWIFGTKRDLTPAIDGDNLILTIDKSIQLKVEEVLKKTVEKHQADGGSIVVMDPKTGAILAMASNPSFDPNEFTKTKDLANFNNINTTGNYESGSVFKAFTMAAAIDSGAVTPDTTYVDEGKIEIDGYTLKNSDGKANGQQTMTQVLEKSLNTGVIFAKEKMGNSEFLRYVKKFGFGEKTGIELPETAGNLSNLSGKIKVNFHTASFGQGISVTPIQLAQAYGALANGGKMMKPFIVRTRLTVDGKTINTDPHEVRSVISAKTAVLVSAMLVNVVENGHGQKAKVAGYDHEIAGKTGTAQVSKTTGAGYQEGVNIGSFAGYGPVQDPRFVMVVRINHPRTVQFAESTATPAFGEIAQFILNYYNIPPHK
jgi:cell division protein FtsI/penicillin-binding protein 2